MEDKTKQQLIEQLESLRQEVAELKQEKAEHKQAEETLQGSEERFRALVENSSDIIQVVDEEGVIRYVSPSIQRILGYKREEVIGRLSVDFVHPDDLPIVAKGFEQVLQKPNVPVITECRCKHKDGTWRVIEGTGINRLDYPSVNGFISNMHDITERKKVEEALRESEEFNSSLLSNSPNPILVLNPDTSVRYVNPALEKLTGFSSSELVGTKAPHLWWTEETLQKTTEDLREGMRKGIQKFEELFQKKDGQQFWAEVTGILVKQNGELKYYIAAWVDITERKRAEEQLERSFTDLAETVSRAMSSRDPYTADHQNKVAELARLVGKKMGLDKHRLEGLYIGALLHDIGKISTPESILSKPGKLAEEEWALIRAHAKQGYEILNGGRFPWPVADMAVHPHERLDGSGYPHGISGDKLSLEVRILGVCDVVEAMSSHRPYRPARSKGEVLGEIKSGRGTKYDANVVDIMLQIIESGEFEFGWG